MAMRSQLDRLRLAIKLAPTKLHDWLFEIACRVLLPISTMCKVCNILRGMLIGALLGIGLTCFAIAPFIHHWWGC